MIVFIDVLFACCLSANWFFSILFSSQSTAIFSVSYWFRFFLSEIHILEVKDHHLYVVFQVISVY